MLSFIATLNNIAVTQCGEENQNILKEAETFRKSLKHVTTEGSIEHFSYLW